MPRSGTGRVYQRGGVWWIQYGYRGEDERESSKSKKRGDAVKLLKQRLGEIGAGMYIGPDAERVTFDDLVAHLKADYRKNGRKTWARQERSIKHLRPFFNGGRARAAEITTGRMNQYILHRLDDGAKPATVHRELAALSRMFTLAVEYGELPARPKIPTLRFNNARKGFLDGSELEAVIAGLPDPLKPVARFASLTGWRLEEVLGLSWAQVDFEYGVITLEIGTTKNNEGRTFPFGALPPLVAVLEAQRERTRTVERQTGRIVPYVFHRFGGRRIVTFYDAWNSACEAAGVDGMLFHDLRRTGVRNLVRAGVPEKTAMKLIGHKTRSMFDRYNIVDDTDQWTASRSSRATSNAGRRRRARLSRCMKRQRCGTITVQFRRIVIEKALRRNGSRDNAGAICLPRRRCSTFGRREWGAARKRLRIWDEC